MPQSSGWYIYTLNTKDKVAANPIQKATVNTDPTGAGASLQKGETFQVNGAVFTYQGLAQSGNGQGSAVPGFWATVGTAKFFFAQAPVSNNRAVTLGTGDQVICFYPGTLIRTPEGERAVETLATGDLVLTAAGEARPVRWVGRQTVSTVFADPLRVLPVRIAAGALAEGLPARDLLVSPDHALLLEGVLVQAGALVNGTTIRRESQVPESFTYFHVELADHALVLAEGVPAETFVDNVDRLAFDNWAEHEALYGAEAPLAEMDLPRAKAQRQVPQALRARIAARAAVLSVEAVAA